MSRASTLGRRLVTGGLWATVTRLATLIVTFLFNAALARLLEPNDVGVFFLAFSLVTLGTILAGLGLGKVVLRRVAQYRTGSSAGIRNSIGSALRLVLLGAVVIAATYVLVGAELVAMLFSAEELRRVALPLALWIVAGTLLVLLADIFNGLGDIRTATTLGTVTIGLANGALALGALLGYSALWGAPTLAAAIYIMFTTTAVAACGGLVLLLRRLQTAPDAIDQRHDGGRTARNLLHASWPLLVTNTALFFSNQADLWIVGIFLDQGDVATYGAVIRLVLLLGIPLQIVNIVVAPMIAELHAAGDLLRLETILRSTATVAGTLALVGFVAYALFGELLLRFVYGPFYGQGALALTLLGAGQLVAVAVGSCGITLIMTGRERTAMHVHLVSGLVTVVGTALVAERFGLVGIATAVVFGRALQNVLLLIYTKRLVGIWTAATPSIGAIVTLKDVFASRQR